LEENGKGVGSERKVEDKSRENIKEGKEEER